MNDRPPSSASARWVVSAVAIALVTFLTACGNPVSAPPQPPDGPADAGSEPITDGGSDDAGTGDGNDGGGDGGFVISFELQFGTAADDELTGVVAASDGTVFAFGYLEGNANGANDGPTGSADALVLKRTPGAESVQQFLLASGGDGTDTFEAALLEQEGLTLVGRTRGAFPGAINAGKFDTFVARMQSDGTFDPGVIQFGDERPQHPRSLVRAANGSLAVSGYNEVYIPTNYVEAFEDPTLAFLGGEGTAEVPWTIESDVRFESPINDFALGAVAATDGSGDVFVARHHAAGTRRGAWVIRFSSTGQVVWERILSGGAFDAATAVAIAPTGEIVVVGSGFRKFVKSYGAQDVFVVWLDPVSGEMLRAGQAGGTESEWAHAVAVDDRGHVFVAGYTLGEVAAPYQGDADLMVLEFDATGTWVGAWQAGTPQWDELQGITVLSDGSIVVAGNTDGELVPGQRVDGRDALLLQLQRAAPASAE